MNNRLDASVINIVAGEDGLEGLEGLLGYGLATGIDVSRNVASELLCLGVESGVAQDGHGVRIVVSGND